MSDRVPPGCVWISRSTDVTGIPLLWLDYAPHRQSDWAWTGGGRCRLFDPEACQHLFGATPEPGEAILLDIAQREWWCEMCGEWIIESDLRICDGVLYHHPCQEDVTKSRAHVVERLPLKEASE